MADKPGKRRLLVNVPRPTRRTIQIIVLGGALAAAVYFLLLTPARKQLTDTEAALGRQQTQLTKVNADLELYRSGQVLDGDRLSAAVGDVEKLVPNLNNSPADTFTRLEELARSQGLAPGDIQYAATYQPLTSLNGSADQTAANATSGISSKTLALATGSMRVVGPLDDILSWLDDIDRNEQLVSYRTTGLVPDPEGFVMSVQFSLWASTEAEWRNGKPSNADAPAVPDTSTATTTTP